MLDYKEISQNGVSDAIDLIGREQMLIGACAGGKVNAMTASWGTLGVLWNTPVLICFIRPQRFTYGLVEKSERVSFSFFGKNNRRDVIKYCGTHSGRDEDKLAAAGLLYGLCDNVPVFDGARLTLICKKLYCGDLKKEGFVLPETLSNYPDNDFHRFYVCGIEKCLADAKIV